MEHIDVIVPAKTGNYVLVDCGEGRKLETIGSYTLIRPDPRALWSPQAPSRWESPDAAFIGQSGEDDRMKGTWAVHTPPPESWCFCYDKMKLTLKRGEFKNIGVFPEQAANWDWLKATISSRPLNVLNLFAYTGGATIAAALAGARVTHVDSVKSIVNWAKENALQSGLPTDAIRWIVDDAMQFVLREGRRGVKYDGIILDPPRFGRGPSGEVWKLSEHLPDMVRACVALLSHDASFLVLNAYTADLSSIVLHNMLQSIVAARGGALTVGELALREEGATGRLLPSGLIARWAAR